jgi:hypothetical protein
MNAAATGEARRDHGCGRVNAAAIITARKMTSGTEIKNQSSFGIESSNRKSNTWKPNG